MTKAPNLALRAWVEMVAQHTQPSRVHWWAGSEADRRAATEALAESGAHGENDRNRAPVLIATPRRVDAGPTNTWVSSDDAQHRIWPLFRDSMRQRTLYVVPYLLGAPRTAFCKVGVELTDSPHVALSIHNRARAGKVALDALAGSLDFARGLHASASSEPGKRLIVHFPDIVETWSFGSTALDDALFCGGDEGLRLAISRARDEGWFAEHMSLFVLRAPGHPDCFIAAACADDAAWGDLQDMSSNDGWRFQRLGGHAAWMRPGPDGQLWAIDPEARAWQPPTGVPLSALLFCGRQARATPLVYEARSWRHGVYVGATLMREVEGTDLIAQDPMSMLQLCGYNMGDYFAHWLALGRKLNAPPKIFHLNWFRADGSGRRLWPGGAANLQVLKWIAGRVAGSAGGRASPLGLIPDADELDTAELASVLGQVLSCNHGALLRQAEAARKFLSRFGEVLPAPLLMEHRQLVRRLQESLH